MKQKPLWRTFEEASIDERCKLLGCDWFFEMKTPYGKVIHRARQPNLSKQDVIEEFILSISGTIDKQKMRIKKQEKTETYYSKDRTIRLLKNLFRLESMIETIHTNKINLKWHKALGYRNDSTYNKLVQSFYGSVEWKEFRQSWLKDHPACFGCDTKSGVLQVHHRREFNIHSTILNEGFIEGLKHPERFWTLCSKCHSIIEGYSKSSAVRSTEIITKIKKRLKIENSWEIIKKEMRKRSAFFERLLSKMAKKTEIFKTVSASSDGIVSQVRWNKNLSYEINIQDTFIRLNLWMHYENKNENKHVFDIFFSGKEVIEEIIKNEMIWKRMDDFSYSVIQVCVSKNIGWSNKETEIDKLQDEIIAGVIRFENVFQAHAAHARMASTQG